VPSKNFVLWKEYMKRILFLMAIVLAAVCVNVGVVAKHSRVVPVFADRPPVPLKDWTFLVYMNIDQLGQYALQNINDIAAAMRNETTNVVVCCNYNGAHAWIWELREGLLQQVKHVDTIVSHVVMLPSLMGQVVDAYPARQYGLIVWGHGSGAVDNVFNAEAGRWEHPVAPLNCADGFCSLRSIVPTAAVTRGILYDNNAMTCMTNQQVADACREIAQGLPRGKLDALITDACGMADIAIATALADSVLFLTGTQDCQRPDGLAYRQMFNELNKRGVKTDD
jgi:hypothetical protein